MAHNLVLGQNGSPNQIIIQNQNDHNDGSCLPCDEGAACSITPTNAQMIDLGNIHRGQSTAVRFNFANNSGVLSYLTLLGDFGRNDQVNYPSLAAIMPPANNAFEQAGFLVNGIGFAAPVAQMNKTFQPGYFICKVTVRFASDNSASAGIPITLFSLGLRAGFGSSVETEVVYDPFCDCCFTSNSGNFTTHCYTGINLPVTWRRGAIFGPFPVASSGIIELNISYVGMENTPIVPASTAVGYGGFTAVTGGGGAGVGGPI